MPGPKEKELAKRKSGGRSSRDAGGRGDNFKSPVGLLREGSSFWYSCSTPGVAGAPPSRSVVSIEAETRSVQTQKAKGGRLAQPPLHL